MLKKERLKIIRKYYPNAITLIDSVNRAIDYYEDVLQLEPSKIMFADSICSDDVNSIQYPTRAQEFLGPFKMGGLNGFPFTGLTGMKAFASHVPDDGAVLIYYGPHIGITKKGILGEIHRVGQSKNSNCCGAAKGALSKLLKNEIIEQQVTEMDYQMNVLEQILLDQKSRILDSDLPIIEATEVIYEAIDQRINELVALTKYNCKFVILVGAVLINSDSDMGSYTSTKRFDIINLEDNSRKSVIDEFLSALN
jgi:Limiting CO2-inducible proteins B/C beta carbonyic anhydrases